MKYPTIKKVSPRKNYTLFVEFDNNERGLLNMKPYLNFGVFNTIKDIKKFNQVRVSFDTIEWSNDLAPNLFMKNVQKLSDNNNFIE